MSVSWTKEQQKVIDLRNRNILVSAAAGSGKTAVLVERIIRRIMDEAHPVDVDRFLLMTFTESAAAEMKERIVDAIEKQLEQDPSNLHLKKQFALARTAKIMTIHSFCLFVIREYFHTIHLDPSFRIGEEGELKLIRQEAVEAVLEKAYEEGSEGFLRFAEQFASGKEDKELETLITRLCAFAESYPEPEAWLEQCVEIYRGELSEEEGFLSELMALVQSILSDLVKSGREAIGLCEEADGPYMYLQLVEEEYRILCEFMAAQSFSELYRLFSGLEAWKRMPANRDKSVDKELAEKVKNLRAGWKAQVDALKEQFFFQDLEHMESDMRSCLPVVEILVELVKEFRITFREKKNEKNLIDFNDMEHLAVEILTRVDEEALVPSEAARELSEQFEEILIDEYQDSNYIQEAILSSVSKMERGEYNIFRVGDVKQSIYRFRLSRPELFMEKYESYSEEESQCQRIDLSKNFRSRKEVLFFVNAVFSKIMRKQIGKVEYDAKAALYVGANYPEIDGNETEILVVDGDFPESAEEAKRISVKELEARAIAGKIHSLMRTQMVWDKRLGAMRQAEYRDIVVLTRTMKGWSEVFVKTLKQEGIPACADSKAGYFSTLEVGWLLDYLKILDNYRQDIPLTAVLKSPFGNCSNEELAIVRKAWPGIPFFEAVFRAAGYQKEENVEQWIPLEIQNKLEAIFERLEGFRRKLSYTAIHDLLWEILKETGFGWKVAAMPGGEQRYANLLLLIEKAKNFENSSYKGLFHFVRYIEQLQEYDVDYGEADIFGEGTNAVRIMSIHKSKGLEFPIVILSGMGKQFNLQDAAGNLVIHPRLGIGIHHVDLERRTRVSTLLKMYLQKDIQMESLGEELRVLYVAMTRAREKLILTGVMKKAEEKLEEYREKEVRFLDILEGKTYFSWVLPAICQEGSEKHSVISYVTYDCIVQEELEREHGEGMEREILLEETADQRAEQYVGYWREQFEYQYPEQTQMKLKYTVSELKQFNEVEDGEVMVPEEIVIEPGFLQGESQLTGASRGSAYHKVMELLDFKMDYDEAALENALEELKEDGYLSEEMRDCVRRNDILSFLHTETGRRMQRAAIENSMWREQPFVFGVPAREMYPDTELDDLVLIQGIIDAYFEEEDGLVVLDYKTDRVTSETSLLEKYKKQLDIYGRALEQITGRRVKEKIIYSFTLGREISWGKE